MAPMPWDLAVYAAGYAIIRPCPPQPGLSQHGYFRDKAPFLRNCFVAAGTAALPKWESTYEQHPFETPTHAFSRRDNKSLFSEHFSLSSFLSFFLSFFLSSATLCACTFFSKRINMGPIEIIDSRFARQQFLSTMTLTDDHIRQLHIAIVCVRLWPLLLLVCTNRVVIVIASENS